MHKYELKSALDWTFASTSVKAGEVVATIESEISPVLLFDGERSGRLQVVSVEGEPDEAVSGDDNSSGEPESALDPADET